MRSGALGGCGWWTGLLMLTLGGMTALGADTAAMAGAPSNGKQTTPPSATTTSGQPAATPKSTQPASAKTRSGATPAGSSASPATSTPASATPATSTTPPASGAASGSSAAPTGATPGTGASTSSESSSASSSGSLSDPDWLPPQANARVALKFPGYTLSVIGHRGAGVYAPRETDGTPVARGFRLVETGGVISGLLVGGLLRLVGVAAAGMPDSVSISASTETRYRSDGTRESVTTEKRSATYGDPEGRQRALDSSEQAALGLIGFRQQSFELDVYTRTWPGALDSDARGYRASFLFTPISKAAFLFQTGLGFGRVYSLIPDEAKVVDERYFGMPFRIIVPYGPFYLQGAWDLNFRAIESLKLDDDADTVEVDEKTYLVEHVRPSPLTLSVHMVLWRVAISMGLETPRLLKGDIGGFATIGVRL